MNRYWSCIFKLLRGLFGGIAMKKTISILIMLALVLGMIGYPTTTVEAADGIVDIYSVEQFRQELEKNQDIHLRLQSDIIFTKANAYDVDSGTVVGEGYYTIDLNSHTVKYQYKGRVGDPDGVPIRSRGARELVINGPGSVIGGGFAVEQDNQFGVLVINGATLQGVMNSGIFMKGGLAIINSGVVTGNFDGVFHGDGIVVVNGGNVKSIFHKADKHTPQNIGVIRSGIFTGKANIDQIVLMLPKLTISKGSSMRIYNHGGLVVNGAFVNQGTYTFESGLEAIGGEARIKSNAQIKLPHDLTLSSLYLENNGNLYIENGANVTVNGAFVNDNGMVDVRNGSLNLLGTVDNRGAIEGVPEFENRPGDKGDNGKEMEHHPSEWAAPEIERVQKTWLKGSRLYSFYQKNITREEFCELVVALYENMKNEVAPIPTNNPFIDNKDDHVLKANSLGIVNGRGDGSFDPNGNITREDIATMYTRLLKALDINALVTMEYVFFQDEKEIHSYAKNSVQTMYKLGILKGEGGGVIAPLKNSTREQAISLSNRVYELKK